MNSRPAVSVAACLGVAAASVTASAQSAAEPPGAPSASSAESTPPAPDLLSLLGFDLGADMRLTVWYTADDHDEQGSQGNAIAYDVPVAASWQAGGRLLLAGHGVIGGSVERPFRTVPAGEALSVSTERQATLERYLFFLRFPLLRAWTDSSLLEALSRVRLDYASHRFAGRGRAVRPAVFVSDGPLLVLAQDESFRARTTFHDWALTLVVYDFPDRRGEFRIGAYSTSIDKPHETELQMNPVDVGMTYGSMLPVIVDTRIGGYGLHTEIDATWIRSVLRLGVARFSGPRLPDGTDAYASSKGVDFMFLLAFSPSFELVGGGAGSFRLVLRPALGAELRLDFGESRGNTGVGEMSGDILVHASAAVRATF